MNQTYFTPLLTNAVNVPPLPASVNLQPAPLTYSFQTNTGPSDPPYYLVPNDFLTKLVREVVKEVLTELFALVSEEAK